jgi:hypothetical protein
MPHVLKPLWYDETRSLASATYLTPLAAFGFLPGKEVKSAKIGNLGMRDR